MESCSASAVTGSELVGESGRHPSFPDNLPEVPGYFRPRRPADLPPEKLAALREKCRTQMAEMRDEKWAYCLYHEEDSERTTADIGICIRWFSLMDGSAELAIDCDRTTGVGPLLRDSMLLLHLRKYKGTIYDTDWVVSSVLDVPKVVLVDVSKMRFVRWATYIGRMSSRSKRAGTEGRAFLLEDGTLAVDCCKRTGVQLEHGAHLLLEVLPYDRPTFNVEWSVKCMLKSVSVNPTNQLRYPTIELPSNKPSPRSGFANDHRDFQDGENEVFAYDGVENGKVSAIDILSCLLDNSYISSFIEANDSNIFKRMKTLSQV